jgi:hypothetical protein
MSRGFPAAVATALAQQHVAIVSFAKLEFPSGTVYVHNSLGTYTWGGQDWLGVGDLGSISQVEEGLDVSPYAITLTLGRSFNRRLLSSSCYGLSRCVRC